MKLNISMIEILNLWQTPIIKANKIFDNHGQLLDIAMRSTGTEDASGKFLPGKSFIDNPELLGFNNWILDIANNAVNELNKEFWEDNHTARFKDMWSWSSCEYSNPYHSHPNTSWAGVYCLEQGSNDVNQHNGSTIFYNPAVWGTYLDAGLAFLDRRAYYIDNLKKGDLILFPGYLKHSARYTGLTPRTVIAFNLIFD